MLPLAVGEEVPVEDHTFGATGDEGRVHGVPCWDCLWVTTSGLRNEKKIKDTQQSSFLRPQRTTPRDGYGKLAQPDRVLCSQAG
jgi:hypothetical protein